MDTQAVINELRNRARKFVSLDSPQDSDLADLAVDIGAGFVPVVGTATAGRDFERARRENDKLGMALSSLGMVPVVGGVTAGINKLRKGAKAADDAAPALREVIEQAVAKSEEVPEALANFGKKKTKEAARQKEIEKTVREAEARATSSAGEAVEETAKKAGGQRKSGALPEGATVTRAGIESVYEPLQYGQGQATEAVLRGFADLPEGVSQSVTGNLSESEDIRSIIKQKMERDAQFPSARKDVELMRKFFSEADWAKAVELMRKGMAPAAAVAALGYSLPAMAEEDSK